MKDFVDRLRRSFQITSPTDRIADALTELHESLIEADAQGHAFSPEARLARTALRAISWR